MNLLVILHSARASGAELAAVNYITRWQPHQIRVIALEPGPIVEALEQAGIDVTVIDRRSQGSVARHSSVLARASLIRLVGLGWSLSRTFDCDLVMAHSLKGALVAAPLAWRLRIPFVWSVHDIVSPEYMGRANAVLMRRLVRVTASAVVVNSRTTLASLPKMRKPILLRPPGVAATTRTTYRVIDPSAPCVIAMVGRLAPWKGQRVFIEAFAGEFAGDVRARGLIIGASQFGEVDYVNELIDLVRELNLEEQISFLGHVDDVAHQLERSDILVHCSVLPEPFGAVVIEGLAVGLAVVASDAGGPAEVITSGRDGLLFPPGDVNSLRVALRRLFNDPTYRSALGEEAVKTARRYTYATLAPTSVSWLESVATGQARPGLTDLVSEA